MKNLFIQKIKPKLPALIGVAALLLFYTSIGCPFRYVLGICCPGCGMTRAALSLIKLDFAAALHYHPLIFIMPLCAAAFLLRKKIPARIYDALTILVIIVFVAVYAYRLATGNECVYIDPSQGLIYRIISHLTHLI